MESETKKIERNADFKISLKHYVIWKFHFRPGHGACRIKKLKNKISHSIDKLQGVQLPFFNLQKLNK